MKRRMFVGIPMPESYRIMVGELVEMLKPRVRSRIAWTKPENFHLTLRFLGNVSSSRVADLVRALSLVRIPPYVLQAGRVDFFPSRPPHRVFWIGVVCGHQETSRLARDISLQLQSIGFDMQNDRFVPHLTLGRIKKPAKDPWSAIRSDLASYVWPETSIRSFKLWESVLDHSGAHHRVLHSFDLKSVRGGSRKQADHKYSSPG